MSKEQANVVIVCALFVGLCIGLLAGHAVGYREGARQADRIWSETMKGRTR